MEETLYSRLFQYRERQHLRPEENYLTEILAWTIENIPSFGEEYIKFLLSHDKSKDNSVSQDQLYPYKVYTQYKVNFESDEVKYGYIDLVIITNNNIGFICEHKINSNLSEEQIAKYLRCKDQIENNTDFKTVLVTKDEDQRTQEANIFITWNEIYNHFSEMIKDDEENDHNWIMTKQFLNYLTEVGMGEKETIKPSGVEFYCEAMKLEAQLSVMFTELKSKKWYTDCPGLESFLPNHMNAPEYFKKRWGRIGIEFCDEWEDDSEDSNINIFVGVVVDNTDHRLRDFTSPQLVVLIDCFKKHRKRPNLINVFRDLNESNDFKIEKNPTNKWRLLILKKPLTSVIETCDETYDSQKKAIYNELTQGINIILDHLRKKKIINS
ncbi:MAG: PD-(D/E)XK nuclease family protein [Oscillospiraceae bacterium]|nr:PD-(D/E)XK nuclease family protein [Oscillospiraceae bacterium]